MYTTKTPFRKNFSFEAFREIEQLTNFAYFCHKFNKNPDFIDNCWYKDKEQAQHLTKFFGLCKSEVLPFFIYLTHRQKVRLLEYIFSKDWVKEI